MSISPCALDGRPPAQPPQSAPQMLMQRITELENMVLATNERFGRLHKYIWERHESLEVRGVRASTVAVAGRTCLFTLADQLERSGHLPCDEASRARRQTVFEELDSALFQLTNGQDTWRQKPAPTPQPRTLVRSPAPPSTPQQTLSRPIAPPPTPQQTLGRPIVPLPRPASVGRTPRHGRWLDATHSIPIGGPPSSAGPSPHSLSSSVPSSIWRTGPSSSQSIFSPVSVGFSPQLATPSVGFSPHLATPSVGGSPVFPPDHNARSYYTVSPPASVDAVSRNVGTDEAGDATPRALNSSFAAPPMERELSPMADALEAAESLKRGREDGEGAHMIGLGIDMTKRARC